MAPRDTMQTRDLILHIGHFKTGTTALQVFCARNRALLVHQGLHYSERHVNFDKHSCLALVLLKEAGVSTLMHGYNRPESAGQLWSKTFEELRALPEGAALLVSSEEFMRLGEHPAAMNGLRDLLAGAPDIRLRVIAYLRQPRDHLRSWYNQLIKLGKPVAGFDETVIRGMERIHWDYAQAILPWVDLAGAENVTVRAYHDALRDDDAIYADFLGALGYRLPVTADLPEGDPNPRLDDRLLDIKRTLDSAPIPKGQANQMMARARRQLSPRGAERGFEALAEAARAGIEAVAKLPRAGAEVAALQAALPEPQDPHARALSDMVSVLTRELAQSRATERRLHARIEALERHLGLDQPEEDPEA